jgi:hypothetical protein
LRLGALAGDCLTHICSGTDTGKLLFQFVFELIIRSFNLCLKAQMSKHEVEVLIIVLLECVEVHNSASSVVIGQHNLL